MKDVFSKDNTDEKWIRPWNQKKFDNLYNRDERFFVILVKGLISWMNRNIVLYDEPINHFIFNTGSSYLYMESNGYEYNLSETTGEDTMYMKLPRCILEISGVDFPTEELTSPFARGTYERRDGNKIVGYNAEIRRLPIELNINLKYYLSNFNEVIVLLQELIDKLVFQRYFNIVYLGQVIQCSIEFPGNVNPEINKIDMSSPDPNQRNITFDIKINTNYPLINERSAIKTDKVIGTFGTDISIYMNGEDFKTDSIYKGEIINDDNDKYKEFIDDTILKPNIFEGMSEADIDAIIEKFDTNKNGVIDEEDIANLLEKIKYENYDKDSDLTNNNTLNYDDVTQAINLTNKQDDIVAEYDNTMKVIYVTHINSGDVEKVDLSKYKIIKN